MKHEKIGSIIRIDDPKDDVKHGTHGWQVRVPTGEPRKYHSKLFSDGVHGTKGKALVAAEEYLDTYLKEHPEIYEIVSRQSNVPYHRGRLLASNSSGVTGVYRTYGVPGWDKSKTHKQYYWAAFCPKGPEGQKRWYKRFYVETHGEQEARRLAIEFRQMWEEAVEQGGEALEHFFEEHHEDGRKQKKKEE